jgi:FdhE protein
MMISSMHESWDRRIERATQLAAQDDAARPLLLFYAQLLGLQRDCYHTLQRHEGRLSGSLDRDLGVIGTCVPPILRAIATTTIGPVPLAEEAQRILALGGAAIHSMLLESWRTPSDRQFFPKAILQPYAQRLAAMSLRPVDRDVPRGEHLCPFCGGAPQLSILRSAGEADGGGRMLLCATCLTVWPFRRVRCAYCGEEDEAQLGYFHSSAFDHLRVDVCDTCRRYLKTVDLTRLGIAVPVVDEVAGAPLDVWARDRGYEKIELNLVGL